MGGCCCCASRMTELNRSPVCLHCQASEEREPFYSAHDATSVMPPGLPVQTNMEISTPDTYRAPPASLPYDMGLACSPTLPQNGRKNDQVQLNESRPLGEILSGSDFEECLNLKSDCKGRNDSRHGSPKVSDNEHSKLTVSFIFPIEEDVCPTCLEEYDVDNPRITTKCKHHFHLSCILEWMERSDTCAICDQIMVIDYTFNK